jgi:Leucine-rich repeat (LRR) protein
VTDLKLDTAGVTDAGLAGLQDWVHLRSLSLPVRITDAGLLHLAKLTSLQSINLASLKNIKGPGLAGLKNATALKELDLSGLPLTDAGLAGLEDWKHLEVLELPEHITDAGLLHLAKLTKLQSVNIDSLKGLKGPGLTGLKHATALKKLDLSRLPITDAGLDGIKDWKHLEVLELPKSITDAGLARLSGLKALISLRVNDAAGVTDAGLAHLEGLTNLEDLQLTGTKITDAGLRHLEGLGQLRELFLHKTGVTRAGIEKLKKKLPHSYIWE